MDNNVINICKTCAEDRKKKTQESVEESLRKIIAREEIFFVKAAFTQGYKTEHMWIQVVGVDFDGKKIAGTLNNDPKFLTNIKYKDKVIIKISDVEDFFIE